VEISTPADPFTHPSLHGRAPGWPTTDLEIVDDNNKAQRNMGLSTTPARGAGLCLADAFALVHNAATYPRDMLLRYTVEPEVLRRVKGIQLEVPGGRRIRVRQTGTIIFEGMQPGENRWVGARFPAVAGAASETMSIVFDEIVNGGAVNGFGLGITLGSDRDATIYALRRLQSVFTRLQAGWEVRTAGPLIDLAAKELGRLAKSRRATSPGPWVSELRADPAFLDEVKEFVGANVAFRIAEQASGLRKSLESAQDVDILVCLCSYLERIDSHVTAVLLQSGDRADILQNVRWQQDVLVRLGGDTTDARKTLDQRCLEFIRAWEAGKVGARDYPAFVRILLRPLVTLSEELGDRELLGRVEILANGGNEPVTLQRLHRDVLLQTQSHIGR
jgi:hypothetical protein